MKTKTLIAASILAALAGCKKDAAEKTSVESADTSRVAVVAADLVPTAFEDQPSYSAELRGQYDAILVTTASGVIRSTKAVGARVQAGEALCDIESERYQAQMNAAKAQLEAARNQLELVRRNVEAGSVGRNALDAPTTQAYSAESAFLNAKKLFDDSRCAAPFAGTIASRLVEPFQTVGAGTQTYRLVKTDRLEASFYVPEGEASGVKAGMDAEFYALDKPAEVFPGKIASVDGAADAKNRVVQTRLVVANTGGVLKPGTVGRVRLMRRRYGSAIVVPAASLVRNAQGVAAMVVADGRAHEVAVQLGPERDDSVLVLAGLKAGDKLIVQGAGKVSEGTRVTF